MDEHASSHELAALLDGHGTAAEQLASSCANVQF
jgi:hypothetical protein